MATVRTRALLPFSPHPSLCSYSSFSFVPILSSLLKMLQTETHITAFVVLLGKSARTQPVDYPPLTPLFVFAEHRAALTASCNGQTGNTTGITQSVYPADFPTAACGTDCQTYFNLSDVRFTSGFFFTVGG